ncbi:unnamed protein product [Vicia faba]|uniref:Uncharacterized protein n=1 Tax=Vicia faba TaxID=3906 RepID=A0AAV1AZS9_VICFA|nr:unnamed protein product [Vicia faba]
MSSDFAKGLNKKFAQSKSQIMMMHPLIDVDKAFSLVIQQEREMTYARSVIPNASSNKEVTPFQTNTSSGNLKGKTGQNSFRNKSQGGTRGNNCVCTHCGITNHTIETCFLKHGYPPNFKGKGKTQNTNSSYQSVAYVHVSCDESQPSFVFTQEQYNIIELLEQSKPHPKSILYLLLLLS